MRSIRFLGFTVKVRRSRAGRSYPHVEASGESCRSLCEKVSGILNHRTQWRAVGAVVREVNAVARGWSGYPFGKLRATASIMGTAPG